jgi:hypothetical protein
MDRASLAAPDPPHLTRRIWRAENLDQAFCVLNRRP